MDLKLVVLKRRGISRCKFLLFNDGTLVIGDALTHVVVWEKFAKSQNLDPDVDPTNLLGAGDIDIGGKVTKWLSTGFHVETPEEFRSAIQDIILKNMSAIV